MKQWASRGRPICCGNLHFMDDNTRTGYTYPSPLVAPCPCVVCHQNVRFLFFFFFSFFFWHVVQFGVFQSWRFVFQEGCHVVFPSWSCCFRCQSTLPINSRIPLLPFTFQKISSLTSVIQSLVQKFFCVYSPLPSRAKYSLHSHLQVFL